MLKKKLKLHFHKIGMRVRVYVRKWERESEWFV